MYLTSSTCLGHEGGELLLRVLKEGFPVPLLYHADEGGLLKSVKWIKAARNGLDDYVTLQQM